MNPSLASASVHAVGLLVSCLLLVACEAPHDAGSGGPSRAAGVVEHLTDRSAGPPAATSFGDAQRDGHATLVFLYVPARGFAYQDDESARPTGVTVELLRDFAHYVAETHAIGLQVHWMEEPSWSAFYGLVRDAGDGVFGVGNVTITPERDRELDFSPPYMSNVAALVTHERVPELVDMEAIGEAFAGLAGLVFPGTLHDARLQAIGASSFPGLQTRPVQSNDELIALLASDGGYFGYVDIYNFWRARQAGEPLRRHAAGDDDSETFGVILPNGSDWTPVIRAFFEADGGYVASRRFREHLERHLGPDLAAMLGGDVETSH